MKLERRSLSRLAVPLKALVDRFAFGTLIVASVALLMVGKADVRLLERGRHAGSATRMAPVLDVVGPADRRLAPPGRRQSASWWRSRRERAAARAEPAPAGMAGRGAPARAGERGAAPAAPRRRRGSASDRGHGAGGRGRRRPVRPDRVLVNAGSRAGRGQGHGGGQRARPGRPGDRGRQAQRPHPAADRFQFPRPGDGRAVARPGDPRRRQQPRAGPRLPAAQPAPVGRRSRGHLGPRRRAAARPRGRRGQRDRRAARSRSRRWSTGTGSPTSACSNYGQVLPPEQLEELQQEVYGPPSPPAGGRATRRRAGARGGAMASLAAGCATWTRSCGRWCRSRPRCSPCSIDVAPLVGAGPAGLTSFSTLCVVYFWSLYRPDLFDAGRGVPHRPGL